MKNVTVKFGNHCEVEMPDSCFESVGQAFFTCRVTPHSDLIEAAEDVRFGKITGRRFYMFDKSITGDPEEMDDYPWDTEHVTHVEIDEDVMCD